MSAHTPSPWRTGGVFLPGTANAHVTVWSAPQPGFQSGHEVAKYVHPRDALLISAAPQMWDIVETIYKLVDEQFSPAALILSEHSPVMDAIRDVVAKVKGAAS